MDLQVSQEWVEPCREQQALQGGTQQARATPTVHASPRRATYACAVGMYHGHMP